MENNHLINELKMMNEILWCNPNQTNRIDATLSLQDIQAADQRLKRFAAYLKIAFPETEPMDGIIESELREIPFMKESLERTFHYSIDGKVLLKCDHALPISGSIKARGGIYEVLTFAETLAMENGLLTEEMNYSVFNKKEFKNLFSKYTIAVGSTGNLGLSIGIMGAKLGFKVTVHMSSDAKQWKKDLLRAKGVCVKEYTSDYSKAVEEGRKEAQQDDKTYFIDDENSQTLFLGYSVAALRLKKQLLEKNIIVDQAHPLFFYLPCGVGGAPGGITFGVKMLFGENAHCFFAEPTHSPAMFLGLMTGKHNQISVHDIGIDNITSADGLAVGRPSGFVGKVVEHIISGCYTVSDENMFRLLKQMKDSEGISLEPSALAGAMGPIKVCGTEEGQQYINKKQIDLSKSTHIIWATGGNMVPEAERKLYYEKAEKL